MGLFDKIKEPIFLKDDSESEQQLAILKEFQKNAPAELHDQINDDI